MKKLNLKSIEAFLRKGKGFFYACLTNFQLMVLRIVLAKKHRSKDNENS